MSVLTANPAYTGDLTELLDNNVDNPDITDEGSLEGYHILTVTPLLDWSRQRFQITDQSIATGGVVLSYENFLSEMREYICAEEIWGNPNVWLATETASHKTYVNYISPYKKNTIHMNLCTDALFQQFARHLLKTYGLKLKEDYDIRYNVVYIKQHGLISNMSWNSTADEQSDDNDDDDTYEDRVVLHAVPLQQQQQQQQEEHLGAIHFC